MAGNIKGITIQFDGDVTKLDKSIREVNKESRALDKELKQIEKSAKFSPKSVTLWKQKQQVLTRSITETEKKVKLLKQRQAQMDANGVQKNSAEYRKLQREIVGAETKLKNLKAQAKSLNNVKLTALSSSLKSIGGKITGIGKDLSMKVTAPLVAVGAVSVSKFAEVDKTMQLTKSTMGATTGEAKLLEDAMKNAAMNSTFGMNDAATASLNFARAGLSAKDAADALAPSMALAAGEGGDLDTVSAGLVATINGFHGSFEQTAQYADVFANACNNSALDVNSLSSAMSVAAPIFSSAGYSVNDAALYMGVMANNGIDADKAANSLKTGLARLVSPAKDGAKMMEQLGISVTNSDGTMKSSVQIQQELHNAFGKLSESEKIAAASAIFGKNQMAPWLALINTAPGDVDKLNTAIGQNGTAMQMQSDMMSGFGGSLEQLKSSADVASTSLGEALAPTIQTIADLLQQFTNWFNTLSPETQQMIATIGLVVAAAGPLLMIVGLIASGIGVLIPIITTIVGVIGTVAGGIGGLVVAMGPIGWIILGIVAAGILLWKNWDKVKKMAKTLAKAVSNAWKKLKEGIAKNITAAKTKALSVAKSIKERVSNVFSSLKEKVSSVWKKIKDAITKPITSAKSKVSGIISKIKGFFPLKIKKAFSGLKLPHFSITSKGKAPWGIAGKGSLPKWKIEWYRQAMANPQILHGATLFGTQNGRLLAGGEAGDEMVGGVGTVAQMITQAVANGMQGAASEIAGAIGPAVALSGGPSQIVLDVYLYKNGPQMGRQIVNIYDTWKGRLG